MRTLLEQAEDDEDDEEHFVDAPDSDDDTEAAAPANAKAKAAAVALAAKADKSLHGVLNGSAKPRYEPLKREPIHAGADRTCFWELLQVCCNDDA